MKALFKVVNIQSLANRVKREELVYLEVCQPQLHRVQHFKKLLLVDKARGFAICQLEAHLVVPRVRRLQYCHAEVLEFGVRYDVVSIRVEYLVEQYELLVRQIREHPLHCYAQLVEREKISVRLLQLDENAVQLLLIHW